VARTHRRYTAALLLALGAFLLYLRTTAPSVATLFDDSLEFQVVIPLLGVPHPPGYPLYVLLGKVWTLLLPLRDPAWRLNVLSTLFAALALVPTYLLLHRIVPRRRLVLPTVMTLVLAPTFWAQATIAEVYALHMLLSALLLYAALPLLDERALSPRRLYLLAALVGLGLAHHRMIVLLLPTIAYWLWIARSRLPRRAAVWGKVALALGAPLLLYLYIPLIGARVGSLDGTYVNTWPAFWDWVQARAYRVFLTGNPFDVHRGAADYVRLFLAEMGLPALLIALVGTNLTRWRAPLWHGFILALVAQVTFVVNYKVADVDVFFLPVLWLALPFIVVGLAILEDAGWNALAWVRKRWPALPAWLAPAWTLLLVALLLLPGFRATVRQWAARDRSDDWQVYDLGADIMQQPLPEHSTIVGILGETTLVRYFRDVLGQRPDVQVVPADREQERLQAIARLLQAGRPVFITRPLSGVGQTYTLDAVGPLVRVRLPAQDDHPQPPQELDQPFTSTITLAGYSLQRLQFHSGPRLRVTLYWDVTAPPAEDYKVSARLVRQDGSVAVAVDDVPVHNTYPTRYWRPGERVQDVYDLPLPPRFDGHVLIILYRAANGAEVGRVTLPRP